MPFFRVRRRGISQQNLAQPGEASTVRLLGALGRMASNLQAAAVSASQ
jgi:hypothetical protein